MIAAVILAFIVLRGDSADSCGLGLRGYAQGVAYCFGTADKLLESYGVLNSPSLNLTPFLDGMSEFNGLSTKIKTLGLFDPMILYAAATVDLSLKTAHTMALSETEALVLRSNFFSALAIHCSYVSPFVSGCVRSIGNSSARCPYDVVLLSSFADGYSGRYCNSTTVRSDVVAGIISSSDSTYAALQEFLNVTVSPALAQYLRGVKAYLTNDSGVAYAKSYVAELVQSLMNQSAAASVYSQYAEAYLFNDTIAAYMDGVASEEIKSLLLNVSAAYPLLGGFLVDIQKYLSNASNVAYLKSVVISQLTGAMTTNGSSVQADISGYLMDIVGYVANSSQAAYVRTAVSEQLQSLLSNASAAYPVLAPYIMGLQSYFSNVSNIAYLKSVLMSNAIALMQNSSLEQSQLAAYLMEVQGYLSNSSEVASLKTAIFGKVRGLLANASEAYPQFSGYMIEIQHFLANESNVEYLIMNMLMNRSAEQSQFPSYILGLQSFLANNSNAMVAQILGAFLNTSAQDPAVSAYAQEIQSYVTTLSSGGYSQADIVQKIKDVLNASAANPALFEYVQIVQGYLMNISGAGYLQNNTVQTVRKILEDAATKLALAKYIQSIHSYISANDNTALADKINYLLTMATSEKSLSKVIQYVQDYLSNANNRAYLISSLGQKIKGMILSQWNAPSSIKMIGAAIKKLQSLVFSSVNMSNPIIQEFLAYFENECVSRRSQGIFADQLMSADLTWSMDTLYRLAARLVGVWQCSMRGFDAYLHGALGQQWNVVSNGLRAIPYRFSGESTVQYILNWNIPTNNFSRRAPSSVVASFGAGWVNSYIDWGYKAQKCVPITNSDVLLTSQNYTLIRTSDPVKNTEQVLLTFYAQTKTGGRLVASYNVVSRLGGRSAAPSYLTVTAGGKQSKALTIKKGIAITVSVDKAGVATVDDRQSNTVFKFYVSKTGKIAVVARAADTSLMTSFGSLVYGCLDQNVQSVLPVAPSKVCASQCGKAKKSLTCSAAVCQKAMAYMNGGYDTVASMKKAIVPPAANKQ